VGGSPRAYSEVRIIAADRLVVLPDGISNQQAAAMMLKGLTAQYLIRQTSHVKGGDTILFQVAEGRRSARVPMGGGAWADKADAQNGD